jgi:tellurite resistance protein
MTAIPPSSYSDEQIAAWLRGLLSLAWADGNFDPEEQKLITQLTHELTLSDDSALLFKSITPTELVEILGTDAKTGENFLRTAVLVAIADGIYSAPEAQLLRDYSTAFGLQLEALTALEHTLCEPLTEAPDDHPSDQPLPIVSPSLPHPDLLHPVKDWLDDMDVHDPRLAKFLCKMIPPQCPFERDIKLFGRKIVHIPPLCKLNPLYDQLVGLRFKSLSYLADECKEDISEYI